MVNVCQLTDVFISKLIELIGHILSRCIEYIWKSIDKCGVFHPQFKCSIKIYQLNFNGFLFRSVWTGQMNMLYPMLSGQFNIFKIIVRFLETTCHSCYLKILHIYIFSVWYYLHIDIPLSKLTISIVSLLISLSIFFFFSLHKLSQI